jgi:hypothetical protein
MPNPPTKPTTRTATDPQEPFRAIVRQAMARLDHSIADVARGSNMGKTAESGRVNLTKWLGGTRGMHVDKLGRIFEYLDIRIGAYSNKSGNAKR